MSRPREHLLVQGSDDNELWPLHAHVGQVSAQRIVTTEWEYTTGPRFRVIGVRHTHGRKTPSHHEPGCSELHLDQAPGRGAFPVTIITVRRIP